MSPKFNIPDYVKKFMSWADARVERTPDTKNKWSLIITFKKKEGEKEPRKGGKIFGSQGEVQGWLEGLDVGVNQFNRRKKELEKLQGDRVLEALEDFTAEELRDELARRIFDKYEDHGLDDKEFLETFLPFINPTKAQIAEFIAEHKETFTARDFFEDEINELEDATFMRNNSLLARFAYATPEEIPELQREARHDAAYNMNIHCRAVANSIGFEG